MPNENPKSESEVVVLTPEQLAQIETRVKRAETLATVLDKGYLDPLLGLFEGQGDVMAGLAGCYIIFEAKRLNVPPKELAKMIGRTTIDTFLGSIPIVGDIFDFVYKSNLENAKVLREHFEKIQAEAPTFEEEEGKLIQLDRAREAKDLGKRAA